MASFTLSIEDSSPLISYSPPNAWSDSPDGDTLIPAYSGGSLHTTSAQGATATFTFSGTGFTLFGGLRPNYGTFSVTLDGQTLIASGSANRAEAAVKQVLASADSLPHASHTVVITNTGTQPIDIDAVGIKCEVGDIGSQMSTTTYDDSDPRITYLPSTAEWTTNTGDSFMDNTLHFSDNPNAGASMTFTGDAVALYGTVSPDHADLRVTIDGRETTLNGGAGGQTSALHTKTLLWYADKLGQQQHTLLVNSAPGTGTGPFIDIDQVAVFAASGGNPASTGVATQPPTPTGITSLGSFPTLKPSPVGTSSKKKGLPIPIAAIIVIAIGSLLLIATIVGCTLFIRRRRALLIASQRDVEARQQQPISPSVESPTLPFQQEKIQSPVEGPQPTFEGYSANASLGNDRSQAVSRGSMSSMIIPFYAEARGDVTPHSRTGSVSSTAQLLPSDVPTIRAPKQPRASRVPVSYQIPARPSQRPPPLDVE